MTNSERSEYSNHEVVFFGQITANVTHELNNVISIIDQTAGLLDDLLIGEQNGRPMTSEKLKSIADNISRQTQRGLDFLRQLNRFAHTVDAPRQNIDLNEFMGNLVALSSRFARLKKVDLRIDLVESRIELETNAFSLFQLVFKIFQQALERSAKGQLIIFKTEQSPDAIMISLTFPINPELPVDNTVFDHFGDYIVELGGNLAFSAENETQTIRLTVPEKHQEH